VRDNVAVGTHTRAQEPAYVATKPPRRRIFLLALLLTATLVAWGVLVYAAIDFGGEARSGEPTAWTLLAITTVGAAACLFVTLILGSRLLALVRGRPAPVRPKGGHRATR
jgi:RsiW-degrading membrane proteinase PrsW (M82 family)